MSGPSEEVARFVVQIDRDDVARFAAAVGYRDASGSLLPPTYPIRLLAVSPAADYLRAVAAAENGAPVHVSQSFDYVRRPRLDEALEVRMLFGFEGDGPRRQAVLVLELHDAEGRDVGRAESRFVFARALRQIPDHP